MDFCFDIDWVQENCIPVYINVNFHFFLDDNCEGNLAAAGYVNENLEAANAFNLAENLIIKANNAFENMGENSQWNQAVNNATETDAQCIPIRYVINGIYVHCDLNAQTTALGWSKFNSYEVDGSTTMNIYVSDIIGGTNGFANNVLWVSVVMPKCK